MPSPQTDGPFAVVDVETTGGNAPRNRIIEIAIVRVENLEIRTMFSTLVDPGRPVPRWIFELTGIDPSELETAPRFEDVADQARRHLEGATFVAHNAAFDYGFVRREYARLGEAFEPPRLCTCRLARRHLKLSRYKLDDVTRALKIRVKNRHRALGDAIAAARILISLLKRNAPRVRGKASSAAARQG